VKSNSNFSLDFNNYNNQVIKLKSQRYPRYKLIIFSLLLLSIIAFLFFNQTQNKNIQVLESATSTLNSTQEPLSLPPIETKSVSTLTFVEQETLDNQKNTQSIAKAPIITVKNNEKQTIVETITVQEESKDPITASHKINNTELHSSPPSTITTTIAATKTLTLPVEVSKKPNLPIDTTDKISYTIKSGDNLAWIFKQHNLSKKILHNVIHTSKHGKQLARIKPGQKIIFSFNTEISNGKQNLQSISLQKTRLETLNIVKNTDTKNQFISTIEKKEPEIRQQFVSVTIKDSLFLSATKAGLSDSFTMELAQLFGWDIDFALEIRNGDSFSVLYNELYLDGKKISNGQILAAEFVNQGKLFETIYYTDASGKSDYYSSDGYSKRKAFLRTPVEFSRISSRFSTGRRHPVLNKIRAHRGVDYAASRGTPIKSAGDGKVSFKGRKGGYGRVIQINHGSKYMTVYAHMKSFSKKIKRGSRVKQGQIIGYVGSSGLATGPHLHYEFRVNGVHRNPLTVTLPKANPINKKYRQSFTEHSETMLSSLKLKKHEQIALLKQ